MDIAHFVDMLKEHVGDWFTPVIFEYEGKELVIETDVLSGPHYASVLTIHLVDKES